MIRFESNKNQPAVISENRFHRIMDTVAEKKTERALASPASNNQPSQVTKDNVSNASEKRDAK